MGNALSFPALCAFAGFALIFVAILGGGLTIKELSLPPLRPLARMMVAVLGAVMLGVALLSSGSVPKPITPQGVVKLVDELSSDASSEIAQVVIRRKTYTLVPKAGVPAVLELPADEQAVDYAVQTTTIYPDGRQIARSGTGTLLLSKDKTYYLNFGGNHLSFR